MNLGATERPWSRTCPQYCWRQPWVQAIYADVEDYDRGSLGCVLDLPAPYVEYLRVASSERAKWRAEQDIQIADRVTDEVKKK